MGGVTLEEDDRLRRVASHVAQRRSSSRWSASRRSRKRPSARRAEDRRPCTRRRWRTIADQRRARRPAAMSRERRPHGRLELADRAGGCWSTAARRARSTKSIIDRCGAVGADGHRDQRLRRPIRRRGRRAGWRRRTAGSGRRTTAATASRRAARAAHAPPRCGSSRVSSRAALPGSVRRVSAGTSGMSLIARRTSCSARSGSVAGQPPRGAEQARRPVQGDVGAVGDLERAGDQTVRVVAGVGEAEVVEHGDADEHVAGALAQPGVERRRHADLDRRRRSRPATPAPATASGRRGPVGSTSSIVAAPRRPTPAAGPGRCRRRPTRSSAVSTARRCCAASSHSSSSGRTTSARSWRPRRKKATGGPHSAAASSPERRRVASRRPPRASCRPPARGGCTLRSTAALHGSANGRSVIVATHSASAVSADSRSSSSSRRSAANARIVSSIR